MTKPRNAQMLAPPIQVLASEATKPKPDKTSGLMGPGEDGSGARLMLITVMTVSAMVLRVGAVFIESRALWVTVWVVWL